MLLLNVYLEEMHYVKCPGSGCLEFISNMGTKVLNIAVEEEGQRPSRGEGRRREERGGGKRKVEEGARCI